MANQFFHTEKLLAAIFICYNLVPQKPLQAQQAFHQNQVIQNLTSQSYQEGNSDGNHFLTAGLITVPLSFYSGIKSVFEDKSFIANKQLNLHSGLNSTWYKNHLTSNAENSGGWVSQRYGFCGGYNLQFSPIDFSALSPELDSTNLDRIGKSSFFITLDMAYMHNRFLYGFLLGGSEHNADEKEVKRDTLTREFNGTRLGIFTGYALMNNRYLFLAPKLSVEWHHYRLLNNPKGKKIPLEHYISERGLDLRFNQFNGSLGLCLAFKIRGQEMPDLPFIIGFSGGYQVGLGKNTMIRSQGNRLTTKKHIDFNGYYFNMVFYVGLN
jgi:hypothetical protein